MNPATILQETLAILGSVGRSYLHILPYLALSVGAAVWLRRSGAGDRIRKGLGANPYRAVLLATLVGALSPFCSCGVIPIITGLLLGGVPLAPVMAFWLASPSMDPEIFLLSVGTLGWELAIWRLGATFAMSLGGGLAVLMLEKQGWLRGGFLRPSLTGEPTLQEISSPSPALPCCAGAPSGEAFATPSLITARIHDQLCHEAPKPAPAASGCGCTPTETASAPTAKPPASLVEDGLRSALQLSFYLLVAFLLSALITRYVPQDLIVSYLGSDSAWSVPLATLIGVPTYTTNLTSLGLVAGLLKGGMSGGAALAFLVGGAVTTLPAMSAVYGVVRLRIFLLYLGFCFSGALLAGLAYQMVRALG